MAGVHKPQEVKRFGLPLAPLASVRRSEAAKLDQAGFLGVKCQLKLREAFA